MKPSPWMHSEADGAYSDKISFYAPMVRLRRGLLEQYSFLRPDDPIAAGAYSGKISIYAPMPRRSRGVFWQNSFLRPDGPISTGLILAKSLSTPHWFDIGGAVLLISPGRILAKSLSKPRCPVVAGAYSGKISI